MNLKQKPHLILNIIFAGVIILIIVYSGIFSAQGVPHPISALHNYNVVSTGLSRAFSEIVRLNFDKARLYNPFSIRIFIFFLAQFILRIIFSVMLLSIHFKSKLLVYTDILISVLLFLWSFSNFILHQFTN